MKFCQKDGTPLVAVADNQPEQDPYATMVGNQSNLKIPPVETEPEEKAKAESGERPDESDPYQTVVGGGITPSYMKDDDDDDMLEIPEEKPSVKDDVDPMKTMIVSGNTADNFKVDVPDSAKEDDSSKAAPPRPSFPENKSDSSSEDKTMMSPQIPKFNEPQVSPPDMDDSPIASSKDDLRTSASTTPPKQDASTAEPPKSPFDAKAFEDKTPEKPSAPIPSPFDKSMPPGYSTPSTPPFEPPKEPMKPKPLNEEKPSAPPKTPFDEPGKAPSSPFDEFSNKMPSSPPTPMQSAANKAEELSAGSGSGTFSPPPASTDATGENKMLAIISLVCGILSILCCFSIITGPAGLITGFLARKKAAESPQEYGGEKLALIGMITGALGIVFFILLVIFQLAFGLGNFG